MVDLFECFSLGRKIGPGVAVGGIQASVSKPISDDSHIDIRSDQLNTYAVSKGVRGHAFARERRQLFGSRLNVLIEFKPNTRRTEGFAIAIDEDRLIVRTGLPLEQRFDQIRRFAPQWTDSRLAALAKKPHLSRGLEADRFGTDV